MAKYFQQQQGPNFSLDFGAALPSVMDRRLRWIFVAAAVVLLFFAISFLRGVYTDLLWFEQLGFRSIFLKVVYTRVALFAAGAVIFAVPATISLFFAYRLSQGPEEQALPAATQDFLREADNLGRRGGRGRAQRRIRYACRGAVGGVPQAGERRALRHQ